MKRKKVIVSGVLCVSISIASVLCGCSSQTENKTGDAFIINNGGEYYINGLVAKMESDGSAKSVGYPKEESDYIYANDNAPVILKNGKAIRSVSGMAMGIPGLYLRLETYQCQ